MPKPPTVRVKSTTWTAPNETPPLAALRTPRLSATVADAFNVDAEADRGGATGADADAGAGAGADAVEGGALDRAGTSPRLSATVTAAECTSSFVALTLFAEEDGGPVVERFIGKAALVTTVGLSRRCDFVFRGG